MDEFQEIDLEMEHKLRLQLVLLIWIDVNCQSKFQLTNVLGAYYFSSKICWYKFSRTFLNIIGIESAHIILNLMQGLAPSSLQVQINLLVIFSLIKDIIKRDKW